jgi:hypothetical protein
MGEEVLGEEELAAEGLAEVVGEWPPAVAGLEAAAFVREAGPSVDRRLAPL